MVNTSMAATKNIAGTLLIVPKGKQCFLSYAKTFISRNPFFCTAANAGSLKAVAQTPLSERLFLPIIPQTIK
jgi:hypothetical protein